MFAATRPLCPCSTCIASTGYAFASLTFSILLSSSALLADCTQEIGAEPWSFVIDNAQAQVGLVPPLKGVATWQLASAASPGLSCAFRGWKQDFLFLDAELGHEMGVAVEFSFQPPRSGCYLVEEFHPAHCNRSISHEVNLEVKYCKGKTLKHIVDQTADGNQWNPVAHLPFYQGHEGKILVRHLQRSGFAAADAFRFTFAGEGDCPGYHDLLLQRQWARQPPSVTLDDQTATKTGSSLVESAVECEQTAFLNGALTLASGEGSAEYMFEPPSTGCYRVDEFHPTTGEGCPLDDTSEVTVDYCLGQQWQGNISLAENGTQWNSLGHFMFYAGTPGKVTVKRASQVSAGTLWAADAIRFTHVGTCCKLVPHVALATIHIQGAGLSSATLRNRLGHHSDVQVALRKTLAATTALHEDDINILALRPGSVIADIQLSGRSTEVSAALAKLQAEELSALCAAVGAKPDCNAELLHTAIIPSPSNYEPLHRFHVTGNTQQQQGSALMTLLPALATIVVLLALYFVVVQLVKLRRAAIARQLVALHGGIEADDNKKEQPDAIEEAADSRSESDSTVVPSEIASNNCSSFDGWEQSPPGSVSEDPLV